MIHWFMASMILLKFLFDLEQVTAYSVTVNAGFCILLTMITISSVLEVYQSSYLE